MERRETVIETDVLYKNEEALELLLIIDKDEVEAILSKGSLEDYHKDVIFKAIKNA